MVAGIARSELWLRAGIDPDPVEHREILRLRLHTLGAMADRGSFTLGTLVDPATRKPGSDPVVVGSGDLTTHGVIVGMTGSGKTGLGIVLLEEALLAGVPALIIDPKGDMGNLSLPSADVTIYTPGSEAGVPLNIIGSLAAPPLSWETESEALRDEIEGIVTSVLGLVGIAVDPLAGREFVLLANLIEHAWR